MELVVVGLSHKTAPVTLREKIAFTREEAEEVLRDASRNGSIPERMLLSTCNRTELYALAEHEAMGREHFLDVVRRRRGIELGREERCLYTYAGGEMVAHLFRVASSIDSMIVGEVQILGQVHDAYEIARRSGTTGPLMHRLLDAAFRVGKRVRSETEIAIGAVSVSSAAVTLAGKIFTDLSERTALLVGSGETGELAALNLREQGIARLLVTNRTFSHAEELAGRLQATAVPFEEIGSAMASCSVVISATASTAPVIGADLVRRVQHARQNRALLLIDIAVPRDVDPAAGGLPNVFLYDIDALDQLVRQNIGRREREIPKVEAIIRQELESFLRWYTGLEVTPLIRGLRDRFETIRAREVERYSHRFCSRDREQIDALTRGIVNKLLHDPTVNIRKFQSQGPEGFARLDGVRRLFELGEEDGGDDAP